MKVNAGLKTLQCTEKIEEGVALRERQQHRRMQGWRHYNVPRKERRVLPLERDRNEGEYRAEDTTMYREKRGRCCLKRETATQENAGLKTLQCTEKREEGVAFRERQKWRWIQGWRHYNVPRKERKVLPLERDRNEGECMAEDTTMYWEMRGGCCLKRETEIKVTTGLKSQECTEKG